MRREPLQLLLAHDDRPGRVSTRRATALDIDRYHGGPLPVASPQGSLIMAMARRPILTYASSRCPARVYYVAADF